MVVGSLGKGGGGFRSPSDGSLAAWMFILGCGRDARKIAGKSEDFLWRVEGLLHPRDELSFLAGFDGSETH